MSVQLGSSGIQFSDSSAQTTALTPYNDLGSLISVSSFSNNDTWYNPGARYVIVKIIGGGGGSVSYCESGGAGGYAEGLYNVTGVSSVGVTIGGGGGGTGYYSAAGNGGTSSFGGYISASGGYGANQNYSHSGGHGGTGSGGQLNLNGGAGSGHVNGCATHSGGKGGQGYFGGSCGHVRNHGNLGNSITGKLAHGAPGSGSPGNVTDGSNYHNHGSNGEAGLVVVYAYK